jgi:hypothetical protein
MLVRLINLHTRLGSLMSQARQDLSCTEYASQPRLGRCIHQLQAEFHACPGMSFSLNVSTNFSFKFYVLSSRVGEIRASTLRVFNPCEATWRSRIFVQVSFLCLGRYRCRRTFACLPQSCVCSIPHPRFCKINRTTPTTFPEEPHSADEAKTPRRI